MHRLNTSLATLLIVLAFFGAPAYACGAFSPLKLEGIKKASIVALGRISNYSPIFYSGGAAEQTDRAEFDLQIDQIYVGQVPKNIHVYWNTPTIALPTAMPPGPYLVALHHRAARSPEPEIFFVVIQPCSGSFIFGSPSNDAEKALALLQK